MNNASDHDLLIRLDQKVENVTDEIRLLRDGSAKRLDEVERGKLDKTAFDDFLKTQFMDHEKRIRKAERYYIGGLAIIGFVDFALAVASFMAR
jgi:hypothetical protein